MVFRSRCYIGYGFLWEANPIGGIQSYRSGAVRYEYGSIRGYSHIGNPINSDIYFHSDVDINSDTYTDSIPDSFPDTNAVF